MMQTPHAPSRHKARATLLTLLVAAACVALFAFTLRNVGLEEIGEGVRRLGWGGFATILALSGLRLVFRSLAWMRCVEGEPRLRFGEALDATLMGEALGNATPFANVISEPSKAAFVRGRVPFRSAFSAIVVENIFYTASVALMIGIGAAAFLLAYSMPEYLRAVSYGALVGVAVVIGAACVLLKARVHPLSSAAGWLDARSLVPVWVSGRIPRVRRFEDDITTFTARNGRSLAPLALYEAAFHLAGVAEVYVTLTLIVPGSVTLLTALVVESTGRVINVLFKFVPLRLGVDEAGNALLALPLALLPASLVTLALVRKARILVWTAVGIGLLFRRGLSVRRALDHAQAVAGEAKG
ncbi:MAG: flippase-like domain-containing protein [Acidobacteria bacterium]|nr:flippase-like domain-containing protein [Acidobacteriota bacterium]